MAALNELLNVSHKTEMRHGFETTAILGLISEKKLYNLYYPEFNNNPKFININIGKWY